MINMEFYGSIDIYASSTAQVAARMEFLPSQHYMDAVNGAKARFCVRFTAYQPIEQPRFKLIAGSAAVGLLPAEHTVILVGEGSPFFIEIPITDEARFLTFPRVTRLKIAVDTADSAFVTVSPAECGVDALKYRLAPNVSIEKLVRCNAAGTERKDGTHILVKGLTITPNEEWAGSSAELLVRDFTIDNDDGTSYTYTLTDEILDAARSEGGYSETVPNLVADNISAAYEWGSIVNIGFSADNFNSASAVIGKLFANLHLSGVDTGGACFGGLSRATHGNPMLESHYPIYAYSGFGYGIWHGTTGVVTLTADSSTTIDVVFDSELDHVPVVVATCASNADQNIFDIAAVRKVSTTGFTLYVRNAGVTTRAIKVNWIAI